MSKPFQDKSVIVTGAGSGIGRAAAIAFAAEGANVTVAGGSTLYSTMRASTSM